MPNISTSNTPKLRNTSAHKLARLWRRSVLLFSICLAACAVLGLWVEVARAQAATATLSGRVYADVNKNNQRDGGEPGIEGVRITLSGSSVTSQSVSQVFTTTASGLFTFTDLPAGVYTLAELQPVAYGDGADVAGSAGGNVGNDVIGNIWVVEWANGSGYMFGETTGSLRGSVARSDVTGGSNGVEGAPVTLTGLDYSGASISKTVMTDSGGVFSFTGLLSGTYALSELQPLDYVDSESGDEVGSTGGSTGNDVFTAIRLRAGVDGTGYRFNERGARIYGAVFVDVNRDGLRDEGEGGMAEVALTVQAASGVVITTQTSSTGSYTFTGFLAGAYAITQTQLAGFGSSTPNEVVLTLTTPLTDAVLNFGEVGGTIGGAVFVDGNRNGARDAGDNGIAHVTMLLTGTSAAGLQVTRALSTGIDGTVYFFGLPEGSYALAEVQPTGYGDLTDTVGTSSGSAGNDLIAAIQLPVEGVQDEYRFAEAMGSLSGQVFRDDALIGGAPGNGVRDDPSTGSGEPGVSGVIIILTGRDANGAQVNRIATTNRDGLFTIANLLAGRYTLVETQPGNYTDGPELVGNAGGTVFDDVISGIQLAAGFDAAGYAFVERRAILSGVVFEDANRNGVRDVGETGIPSVTMRLMDEGGGLADMQQTDADGRYRFLDLRPGGLFVVEETQPNGYGDGTGNALTQVLPALGLAERNFGETLGSLSGLAFFDQNKNGLRDENEVGIGGLPMALFDASGNLIQQNTTDVMGVTGAYKFGRLLAGSYWVSFTLPGGMAFAAQVAGDNAIAQNAGRSSVYAVGPGEDAPGPTGGLVSNLAISKRAATSGDAGTVGRNRLITYTIDVTNTGATQALGVVVSDALQTGLEFVAGSMGTQLRGAQTVQWDVGALGPGAHTSVVLTARLLGTQSTAITNVAQVQAQFVPVGIPSNAALTSYNPNFIVLRNFEAKRLGQSTVLVQWETSLERDTFAFVLYRSTDETSPGRANAVRITPDPIPAQGTNGGGSSYAFVDEDAYFNQPYFYWLQEIEQDGDATDYGPTKLEVGSKDLGLYAVQVYLPLVLLTE